MIAFQNALGRTWQSTLSTDSHWEPVWQTPAKHGLSTLPTSGSGTSKSPHLPSINRFAILQHKTATLAQMVTDNLFSHSTWTDDDSDGDAAHSGDEKTPVPMNLADFTASFSATEGITKTPANSFQIGNSTNVFDDGKNQYLLNVEIQLKLGVEHL